MENQKGVFVRLTCYYAQYTGVIQPSAEIEEISWLTYTQKANCSPVTQLVMNNLKAKGYIE